LTSFRARPFFPEDDRIISLRRHNTHEERSENEEETAYENQER
jgi:hypothetical protein